jgi:serpin B
MHASFSRRCWTVWRTVAVVVVAVLFVGCNGVGSGGTGGKGKQDSGGTNSQNSGGNVDPAGGTIILSNLAREVSPVASDADLSAVVAGNTAFALKVFPRLGDSPDANAIFSPYSISMAAALLAPGAQGATLSGIEQALSFTLPQDRLNPALNRLDQLLSGRTDGAALSDGVHAPILTNANAVWGQRGFSILPAYLDTLAVNYGAGLRQVDFVNATEDSRLAINNWVAAQTNQRILNLIQSGALSSETRLVLTNAIWFKASWASQFRPEATADRSFANRNGSSSSVPFMSNRLTVPYAQVDGCQAIDIPYAGDNLSMLVIMPTSGTFDGFLAALTPAVVDDLARSLTVKDINLLLPKFTFDTTADLSAMLQSLGMSDAFHRGSADFSGIDGLRDISVGAVLHKAFIAVDENGTEAAAATAVGLSTTTISDPAPPLLLTIDHPFIFLIRDRQTGLILFMGKVVAL